MKIILIMGLPGSGKTTLASELAPLINAKRINADEVRKNANDWDLIVKDAFGGERGKNFIGNYKKVLEAQESLGY